MDISIIKYSIPTLSHIFIFLVSVGIPLSIFSGRGIIRKKRLAILDHLNSRVKPGGANSISVLETVKSKYNIGHHQFGQEVISYTFPTLIFITIAAIGFYLILNVLGESFGSSNYFLRGFFQSGSSNGPLQSNEISNYQAATALIISAAFVGSYIWSINYLILRVANFDLTPLDFLRTSTHILLTSTLALIIRHVFDAGYSVTLSAAVVLGVAFIVGYYPSFGLGALVDNLPASFRLKRVPSNANDVGRDLPLDLIDGIDSTIKFRLANYEINDIQNIATENPINIYVSTPYSLVEIVDWVSQAQLLLAIGPDKYLIARKSSIRDICGLISLRQLSPKSLILKNIIADQNCSDAEISAIIDVIESSPHVKRLLQVKNNIIADL